MVILSTLKNSPLYDQLHSWYREELANRHDGKMSCIYCKRIIATQLMSFHLSRSICPSMRVDIDPEERPMVRLIFQELQKRYSAKKKEYWMDSEEQSWLKFQYIVGYCHEGRLKHWLLAVQEV
jgi:hypothetical protein